MERILSILLLLMLPAISSAKAADVLVPAGPLSNALALVEANRIPDAMKTLATFRPDMATLGPYHYIYGRAYAAATAADGRYPESSVETHLLVSATSDNDFLDAAWKSNARLPADCVGVTKVDKATRYGAPYNVSILCGKPIAYQTNGQTVPGDIVSPTREKVLRMILLEGPAGAATAAAAQRYMRCQGGSMRNRKLIRTIAIASGKGGVGKTNVVANLAIALQKSGKQVLIMDADLGMSNVDILLHLSPRYNIQHVISGEKRLSEVIVEGPSGIMVLPASSGVQELTHLDAFQRMRLLEEFETYEGDIDILLIDTSAGISENVTFFCAASQEIVILTNPEPTGLTGSYALIKVLFTRYQEKHFRILVNSVRNEEDAKEVYRKLSVVTDRFLNVSLDYIGYIPYDKSIPDAVRAQQPFLQMFPGTAASRALNELVARFADPPVENAKGTLQFFIGNLISMGDAR